MRVLRLLRFLMRRRHATDEFDEEVRFHLDHLEARFRDAGMTPEAAAYRAKQQFGNPLALREQALDVWRGQWLVDAQQDLRYAVRLLARQPGFACIAIGTIAIAIAANTAIFSVVSGVILRRLPYRDPARLVIIWDRDSRQKGPKLFAQYRDLEHWRGRSRAFETLAGATWAVPSPIVTGAGPARTVLAVPATAQLFPLLGVDPVLGRVFDGSDLASGCTVVLAYRFWHDVAGAPADLAALHLGLDNRACTVVGVMPPDFVFFPEPTEMWVLITPADAITQHADAVGGLAVFGRLAPHVTAAAAQAELQELSHQLDRGIRYGSEMEPVVSPLQDEFTFLAGPNLRLSLLVLFGAVCALLLIACVNVANLLLGRSLGRQRELGIRAAIGSGRARLVRQLVAESAMVSLLAAALGVTMAIAAVRGFRFLDPIQLPVGARVEVDGSVFLFAAGLTLATTLLFGVWPAWKVSGLDLQHALMSAACGSSMRRNSPVVRSIVVAEIALSFVLLAGGALLVQSVARFSSASLGFEPARLIFETIRLPAGSYSTAAQRSAFFDRAAQSLGADPDVETFSFSTALPLRGGQGVAALIPEGEPMSAPGTIVPDVSGQVVAPAYFQVMSIRLERGRWFSSADRPETEPVAILNAAAVKRYFPGTDPLGKRVRFYGDQGPNNPWLTIVGVTTNEKRHRPDDEMTWVDAPILYRAFDQNPPRSANAIVRLRAGRPARVATLEHELRNIDPGVVVGEMETARHLIDRYLAYPQFRAALLSTFAIAALLLALIGLYGVLSQLAGERVREIGVRMALGATRRDVLMLIAREGMWLTAWGLAGGLVGAFWLTTLLASLLFGVTPHDPTSLVLVCVTLGTTSLIATAVPAVRAAGTDPVVAMRQE